MEFSLGSIFGSTLRANRLLPDVQLAGSRESQILYVGGLSGRVEAYAVEIAHSLGIEDDQDIHALRTAALLHDIGKLAIPEYILSKPDRLSDAEYAKMVRHVEIGANILEPIHFPAPIVPIIRYHHERYDGTGYPYGLKGT
jgi:putative nucleotidyltransferase with HDIG domain